MPWTPIESVTNVANWSRLARDELLWEIGNREVAVTSVMAIVNRQTHCDNGELIARVNDEIKIQFDDRACFRQREINKGKEGDTDDLADDI